MSRPEYVLIGPHRYAVHWEQSEMDRKRAEDKEEGLEGAIRYRQSAIYMDPSYAPSYQRRVLLHEILHGVLDITGWNSTGPTKTSDLDDFLVRLDSMLLDTLQRNPHVVAFLTGTGDDD